ncbi:MAG: isocitrate lyase/PEP mutase family protein [Pseudomonadota bacterium]
MERATTKLRRLISEQDFLYWPSLYYPLAARAAQDIGIESAYVGGYVTGGSKAVSEPLLTMDEQVGLAGEIARSVSIPIVADAGAGFGEPLHCMRTVREFITAGVAGVHIEDQLFPKRAHYHKYVAHAIPAEELTQKIRYACRQREHSDPDFVVIVRTDTCRFEGLEEAVRRINMGADEGADMGLLFPRDLDDAKRAPELCKVPLVYVQSRGNRDGRPLFSNTELKEMGYKACIDAQLWLTVSFHHAKKALQEVFETGSYSGMSEADNVATRQAIEDAIGLESFYEIEEETVEDTKWGKR